MATRVAGDKEGNTMVMAIRAKAMATRLASNKKGNINIEHFDSEISTRERSKNNMKI